MTFKRSQQRKGAESNIGRDVLRLLTAVQTLPKLRNPR